MQSAKSTLAVALADERLGKGWRRSQTRSRVIAVLAALIAGGVLYGLFESFRVQPGETKPERQLVGTVDLSIGSQAVPFAKGEAQAEKDIADGALKLRIEAPNPLPNNARTKRIEKQYGIVWIANGDVPYRYPSSAAYVLGYNRVMEAEIERRHGKEFLDRLLRGEEEPMPDKAASR